MRQMNKLSDLLFMSSIYFGSQLEQLIHSEIADLAPKNSDSPG